MKRTAYYLALSLAVALTVTLASCCSKPPEPSYPWLDTPEHFPELTHPIDNELTFKRWELGRRLFFETKLSLDGSKSCASCHFPQTSFATNFPTNKGVGGAEGVRNSPSLANIGYHPNFTREGGVPTLEMQVLVPIQEENEFHNNILDIADTLNNYPSYVEASFQAYGTEVTPFVITRAISCFERTLISGNSPYDRYIAGDSTALNHSEIAGLEVFEAKGCTACHSGIFQSNFSIENNGLYEVFSDAGLFNLTGDEGDRGKFKVPSLRNVALTHPYMHDGSLMNLDEVINHYVSGGSSNPNKSHLIVPFELSDTERHDLKSFLEALTDQEFVNWASGL